MRERPLKLPDVVATSTWYRAGNAKRDAIMYDYDYEGRPPHPGYTDREIEMMAERVDEKLDNLE